MIRRAGIALGSNLGDRMALLGKAVSGLREIAVPGEPVLQAPVYLTPPLDCPAGSPDFFNTVVEIAWSGTPLELLHETRRIENLLGRERGHDRNAPRTVDLDLLYCGELVMSSADLTLPHPRLAERRFVLQPLADIRPDLILPGATRPIRELLQSLSPGTTLVPIGYAGE
jgi:2-amino-4-hydroxy-6-hydroxymethyldihydropteridine diphosphokinase